MTSSVGSFATRSCEKRYHGRKDTASTTEETAMEHGKHTFTFMGTAAGCGVPAFFCDCPACN